MEERSNGGRMEGGRRREINNGQTDRRREGSYGGRRPMLSN